MPNSTFSPTTPSRLRNSQIWAISRAQDAATLRALADELEALSAPTAADLNHITWMLHSVIRGLFIAKVGQIIKPNTLLFRGSREFRVQQ